jgi:hypothetical protein
MQFRSEHACYRDQHRPDGSADGNPRADADAEPHTRADIDPNLRADTDTYPGTERDADAGPDRNADAASNAYAHGWARHADTFARAFDGWKRDMHRAGCDGGHVYEHSDDGCRFRSHVCGQRQRRLGSDRLFVAEPDSNAYDNPDTGAYSDGDGIADARPDADARHANLVLRRVCGQLV